MAADAIIWFIIAHVAFILVHKFLMKKISLVVYFLFLLFFIVLFFDISFSQVADFTAAAVTSLL